MLKYFGTSLNQANDIRCIIIGDLKIAHLAILIFVKLIEQVIIHTRREIKSESGRAKPNPDQINRQRVIAIQIWFDLTRLELTSYV